MLCRWGVWMVQEKGLPLLLVVPVWCGFSLIFIECVGRGRTHLKPTTV